MAGRPRVVVIGAGFGGLAVIRGLRHVDVDVTLVDRNNFHTFQPLLYQVATAGLNAADVAYPVRGILRRSGNATFRYGEVTGVDWSTRQVTVDGQPPLPFDWLVVAAGATTNYFGIPGAPEHTFPLYNLRDAAGLRNHLLRSFEQTDQEAPDLAPGQLTFSVIGGGPTGVEVAGALVELVHGVLRKDFPRLPIDEVQVMLLEAGSTLLTPFSPSSQRHVVEALERRGVKVLLKTTVSEVSGTAITLQDGRTIDTHTVIWAAGVHANPLAEVLGLPRGRGGRVEVGADLLVADRNRVFAIGDIAMLPRGDGAVPQVAQGAIQSGTHVAGQIERALAGRPLEPFRYVDKGSMATIGRNAAITELPPRPFLPRGLKLTGFPAWVAWLGLHLITLMGFRNRFSVFLNWAWNYLTWDRGPRLIFDSRANRLTPADEPS
jgi:NADH dehydrogenase